MSFTLHHGDIPADLDFGAIVAVDTEATGLKPGRDRLCLMQLSAGDGNVHFVQFKAGEYEAPNLKKLLTDPKVTKLFHVALWDLGMIKHCLGVMVQPIFCTKVASRLCRTWTDRHGMKELLKELVGVEIPKNMAQSDWGAPVLSDELLAYAADDVLYLHKLREALMPTLIREKRLELAEACFRFIPYRAQLDLDGWPEDQVLGH